MEKEAKYTELFSEYLESGGELPAAFSQIEGFENLFVARYCDKEIGFETETLFNIKLETKANIVIPVYAGRITALENAISKLGNPQKVRKTEVDGGEQNSQTWALPFNSQEADPNAAVSVEKAAAMPVKGDIITLDSKQYRVLKINGTVAEVLAMYDSSTLQKFDTSGNSNVYANNSPMFIFPRHSITVFQVLCKLQSLQRHSNKILGDGVAELLHLQIMRELIRQRIITLYR